MATCAVRERTAAEPYVQSRVFMDTIVSVEVPCPPLAGCEDAVERAFGWFAEVEQRCTRFDPDSELMRLCNAGTSTVVSPLLFSLLEVALALAAETGGAFDPTVGAAMQRRGFDKNYRTGAKTSRGGSPANGNWRDISLNAATRTVAISRAVVLDLGAVAKGFAIDLAARELATLGDFAINAGGDIFVAGCNREGALWRLGIRHPREPETLLDLVSVSNMAVCTSGDYERRSESSDGHHILDPVAGHTAVAVASVTVIAPSAMLADGFSTAAFVLGPKGGIALLVRNGLDGLIVTPGLERFETPGFSGFTL